jgi:hypothetical protein
VPLCFHARTRFTAGATDLGWHSSPVTRHGSLAFALLVLPLLVLPLVIGPSALAQDVPLIPTPPRPGPSEEALEEEMLEEEEEEREEALAEGAFREETLEEPEEGETVDEGFELPPRPDEPPEFRLRAGAGVSLPTAGDTQPAFRVTQDFEIQLRDVAPFYFGIGGAEILTAAFVIGQVGLNAGLAAWIARDPMFRLQGSIHVHLGAAFGGGFANFDIGGEVDVRMLVADDILELHVRGGFFTLSSVPYVNITGGLGIAF